MSDNPHREHSPSYLDILARLHTVLRPRRYLEVGTQQGRSLRLARCPSLAIDPKFALGVDVLEHKRSCQLFQMSSDSFFNEFDAKMLLGGPVDLAFLDGMHLYEFLLRDFMYVESCSRRNSVVAIHDAIPGDLKMAEREPTSGAAWTGDVWKTILLLKKYRPDLNILCLDSDPTGLVLVTNLNPSSKLMFERYFALIDEFRSLSLLTLGIEKYREEISVMPGSLLDVPEAVLSRFWL